MIIAHNGRGKKGQPADSQEPCPETGGCAAASICTVMSQLLGVQPGEPFDCNVLPPGAARSPPASKAQCSLEQDVTIDELLRWQAHEPVGAEEAAILYPPVCCCCCCSCCCLAAASFKHCRAAASSCAQPPMASSIPSRSWLLLHRPRLTIWVTCGKAREGRKAE